MYMFTDEPAYQVDGKLAILKQPPSVHHCWRTRTKPRFDALNNLIRTIMMDVSFSSRISRRNKDGGRGPRGTRPIHGFVLLDQAEKHAVFEDTKTR
ncbi:hypothetical protein V6N12_003292 [Hibiscus sabdariffa]|uniref:Uncharacterized protein n=1 Tax=Hibiscus sabdariffa TaxID=183260 RepID=A0ABR2EBY0_9ROSI